jgi:hypothetical protein
VGGSPVGYVIALLISSSNIVIEALLLISLIRIIGLSPCLYISIRASLSHSSVTAYC